MEPALRRAQGLYDHPLLCEIASAEEEDSGVEERRKKQQEVGMQMVVARLGSSSVIEVVKLLDDVRQILAGAGPAAGDGMFNFYFAHRRKSMTTSHIFTGKWGSRQIPAASGSLESSHFIAFLLAFKSFLLREYAKGDTFT